jgi:adenosine deaminase
LPKLTSGLLADCHLHFEGSVPLDFLRRLAGRAGHRFGQPGAFEAARAAVQDSTGFLRLYGEVAGLFRGPEDYAEAARAIARDLTADGVGYFEIYVSPEIMTRFQLDAPACVAAITAAFEEARAEGLAQGRVLLDAVRQWGEESAERVLDFYEEHRPPGVVGFGLGGDENARPVAEFAGVYARARALGLRTSVHAGEWTGPGALRDALDALRPDRIDHGLAAAADPDLLRRLAEEGTVLWVGPTSNVATGAVKGWSAHPLARLMAAGVHVAVGADDPLFFGTTTSAELKVVSRLGVTPEELQGVAANGWKGAFCSPKERAAGLKALERDGGRRLQELADS